ncbi:MAG: glycosyltransferase family 2 protein [Elusimicrobia bacterium]|nr:glycosyltransferase family 2 protein [Elusimicrobiota bacterium]
MISVVIVTKNEELNIKRCIDSLVDWVDEILVLDSKSEDKTRDIIKNYNSKKIKLHVVEWKGYGATKNYGLELATGDWILSIDADEAVTEELKVEILNSVKNTEKEGYYIPRLLFFCGKKIRYGGCYPDYNLRLIRKGKGKYSDIPVHERILINGPKGYLKNLLYHYSYNSFSDFWNKSNVYSDLSAINMFNEGKKFTFMRSFLAFFWSLFSKLILKLGVLDGILGIYYHIFQSIYVFVKYAKLWELEQRKKGLL